MSRFVMVLLLALLPAVAGAQNVERQVPVLPEQSVLEIDPELRERLGLFSDFEGFRRARLFRAESGGLVLELEGVREGVVVRERRSLSEQALADLRDRLAEAYGPDAVRPVTREGRGRLVLGQTLLGLGYHGWAVPVALDLDSGQSVVASYLLTAGLHFYLPYRLTRDRSVTFAHQSFTNYGGSRGIVAGLLAGNAAQGDDVDGSADRGRGTLAGGLVGGTVGSLAGFWAVDRWRPDRGTADLWGHMGDVGFAGGALLGYITGPYADETVERTTPDGVPYTEGRTRNRPVGHAITLAGHGAGLVLGGWLGARRDYTTGNVSALRSATILGAQAGLTTARLAGAEDRALAAGALVGGALGVALGDRLLEPLRFDTGEGLLINAGHLAGAALALGTTYLFVDEFENREKLYLSTSTAGALLGAGLVWRAVSGEARTRTALGDSGVRVALHPTALLSSWLAPDPRASTLLSVRW